MGGGVCFGCKIRLLVKFTFGISDCYKELGMVNGDITNDQIFTSSGTGKGRLGVDPWHPVENDENAYVTVKFSTTTHITGLLVKGNNGQFFQELVINYTIDGESAPLYPSESRTVSTEFLFASHSGVK